MKGLSVQYNIKNLLEPAEVGMRLSNIEVRGFSGFGEQYC